MVLAVRTNHGQEHGVGSLVVVRPVFEPHTVNFYGAGVSHRVEKALSTQVGAAGLETGDGQASGQITFQRNEPGFSLGVVLGEGAVVSSHHGDVLRHRGEELPA